MWNAFKKIADRAPYLSKAFSPEITGESSSEKKSDYTDMIQKAVAYLVSNGVKRPSKLDQLGEKRKSESGEDLDDITIHVLKSFYTNDVIYSFKYLCDALLDNSACTEDAMSTLEKILCNSFCTLDFSVAFKKYLIFNVRESEFQYVYGLSNRYLVEAMELGKVSRTAKGIAVEAALRNCFSMLN